MQWWEWLILGAIAAACGVAVYVVNDLKKKGQHCPGSMCGGCPHYCQMPSAERGKTSDTKN